MATSQTGKVTKIKTKTKYSSVSCIVFISTYIVTLIVVMLSIKVIHGCTIFVTVYFKCFYFDVTDRYMIDVLILYY